MMDSVSKAAEAAKETALTTRVEIFIRSLLSHVILAFSLKIFYHVIANK